MSSALLNPKSDFEPGVLTFSDVRDAQARPEWVERSILIYELSEKAPWIFSLIYDDGSLMIIPLDVMSFKGLTGSKITLFRKHTATGRIVPFQIASDDPKLQDPGLKSLPADQVFTTIVPPRFDPNLTPYLISVVDQEQMLFMARGVLDVLSLQLMNPMMGWGGAVEKAAGGTLAKIGARRAAITLSRESGPILEELLAAVGKTEGKSIQKFFEVARRLSAIRGLAPAAKADLLVKAAERLGLEVGGQSVMQGGRILLVAKDARTALQIAADGTITIGKFSKSTLDIVNPTVIRPM